MGDFVFWMIPVSAILGMWAFLIASSLAKARVRELQIRERIALIEKGLLPAPEVDPRGFERTVGRDAYGHRRGPNRHRSAGIALIGVGVGLMVMIGFAADDPQKAIGVGGFIAILGIAFVINSLFDLRQIGIDAPIKVSGPVAASSPIETPKVD